MRRKRMIYTWIVVFQGLLGMTQSGDAKFLASGKVQLRGNKVANLEERGFKVEGDSY